MEIADGLIQHHRIYWGWFGTALLTARPSDLRNHCHREPRALAQGKGPGERLGADQANHVTLQKEAW
jgi:hypothetical protein